MPGAARRDECPAANPGLIQSLARQGDSGRNARQKPQMWISGNVMLCVSHTSRVPQPMFAARRDD
jgi:hypothetical protein